MENSVPTQDPAERLRTEATQGYINLSKWLIALSTGAIVFSVTLVKPNTVFIWKQELFLGLGLLVISILSGVRYVRRTIDYALFNYELILNKRHLQYFKGLIQEADYEFKGEKKKVSDIVSDFEKDVKHSKKKMNRINAELIPLFNWQQWLFYIGIILIALFGELSIN